MINFENKYFNKGFTLAEVLITLAIIGVVAAITLPNLIQKNNEKVTIQKLTKTYSLLSQAYLSAVEEYGAVSSWGIKGRDTTIYKPGIKASNANIIRNNLKSKFKISKICECREDCGMKVKKYRDNSSDAYTNTCTVSSFQTIDGVSYSFTANDLTQEMMNRGKGAISQTYGLITVDIDGNKGKNTHGYDVFYFNLTDSGIVPQGTVNETKNLVSFADCYKSGRGCAAWVIFNKNMDYLHCKGLSWAGKHSCSEK